MKKILFVIVCLAIYSHARGEYRVWKDKKGNSIEAEFVTANATQVVIRDRDGKTFKFNPTKLCAEDQHYLKTAFPPEMEIEFKKSQDRRKHNYGYSAEVTMFGTMKVLKKEQRAYDKSLKAVLLMVGESQQTGENIILDRAEKTFDFKRSRELTLEGGSFRMYDSSSSNYGVEYEGFLAVVLDDKGSVIEVKSSRKDYEENCKALLTFEKGVRFTDKFKKMTGAGSGSSGGTIYY